MKSRLFMVLVWLASSTCTRPNQAVCCATAEDCFAIGVDDLRPCEQGLACVDHMCEPSSCAQNGCPASAAVCNLTSGTCGPCSTSDQCTNVAPLDLCDPASGSCVECVSNSDCAGSKPTCKDHACQGCVLDGQCSSLACLTDGSCAESAAVLYVGPNGTDTGACSRASPCRSVAFALGTATSTINQIVLLPGAYAENVHVTSSTTSSSSIGIHGTGASLASAGGEDPTIWIEDVATTVSGLSFGEGLGIAVQTGAAPVTLNHMRVQRATGIVSGTALTVRDSEFDTTNEAVQLRGGHVLLERVRIHAGGSAIRELQTVQATTLECVNVAIDRTQFVPVTERPC